jgi:hypothetical protein
MNQKDFIEGLEYIYDRTSNVLAKKRKEYIHNDDVFSSFKKGTEMSFHSMPEKVAWEYACKHLESIKSMLNNIEAGMEPDPALINEKFGDAINYLIIIELMLKDKIK